MIFHFIQNILLQIDIENIDHVINYKNNILNQVKITTKKVRAEYGLILILKLYIID